MSDFGGEVPDLYHDYRHGYPDAVIDRLAGTFGLTAQDVVVDLGCGTGQLTLPLARRVRAAVGMDPEPGMLRRARRAARDAQVPNVTWLLGADTDLPALRCLLGDGTAGMVSVAQALHWMQPGALFRAAVPLLRAGGGVAVVTNGTPLWLQDTDWSRALRAFLERWLGTKAASACGTDDASQRRYRQELATAGFEVLSTAVDYDADLDIGQLVGGVYSALGGRLPSADQRPAFAEQIRQALAPQDHFREHVHVAVLAGRLRLPPTISGDSPGLRQDIMEVTAHGGSPRSRVEAHLLPEIMEANSPRPAPRSRERSGRSWAMRRSKYSPPQLFHGFPVGNTIKKPHMRGH